MKRLKKPDEKKEQEALKYKFISNSKVLPYRVDYYVHCNVLCLEVTGKLKDTNRQCRSRKLCLFQLVIIGLSHTPRSSNRFGRTQCNPTKEIIWRPYGLSLSMLTGIHEPMSCIQ